jgi:hypothetical protein
MAWLGFVGHSLHVGLVSYGIHWSTAFSSSVILACGPIFTLLILKHQGIERLSMAQVGGVTLALGGVLMFLSDKLLSGDLRATGGDIVLFAASFLFSYYTVQAKPLVQPGQEALIGPNQQLGQLASQHHHLLFQRRENNHHRNRGETEHAAKNDPHTNGAGELARLQMVHQRITQIGEKRAGHERRQNRAQQIN